VTADTVVPSPQVGASDAADPNSTPASVAGPRTTVSPAAVDLDLSTDAVAVDCESVRKEYPDGTVALRDVSLNCDAGRITVLVGPSGCGKTTLLRSVAGLSPLTAGRISIDGRDVTDLDPRRRGVAMVFQGSALYPDKTAYANIEFPLRMERVPRRERRRRVEAVAALLGLTDLLQRKPAELSGGQRQRVGIGRAVIRRPRVVLMDEPLSALDAELRVRMRTELHGLQRELGMTVIYVTHDQVEALALADRLVVMRHGWIEQQGNPEAVFREPQTEYVATFLGAMNIVSAADHGHLLAHSGFDPRSFPATIGFRAEDVRTGHRGRAGDLDLEGPTVASELLGRERLVHVAVAQQRIRARVHADEHVGSEARLHVQGQDLHFFDGHGRRVDPTM
jgi:ABC-type sugar transport system ATPase subunit